MAQGLSLQQKQSQSLVMTPKLAQSIKLLQMGHVDLLEFLQSEIEKNPLIELDLSRGKETKDRRNSQNEQGQENPAAEGPVASLDQSIKADLPIDAAEKVDGIGAGLDNVYDAGTAGAEVPRDERQQSSILSSKPSGKQSQNSSFDEASDFINQIGEVQSLSQHLEFQVSVSFKSPTRRKIAIYITHMLDEDGYFRESVDAVAEKFGCSSSEVLSVLEKFQTFDPVGIGARDLAECLAIQLRELNELEPEMETFLGRLDLLAKRDLEALRKLCGVSSEKFNSMIRRVKALDPRPAQRFEPLLSEPIVPDVLIRKRSDGGWRIELNQDALPNVLIDRQYHSELVDAVGSKEGREFVDTCMADASWLVKSLDQRAQTILKVATEIVKQQDMFFAEGVENLKPMTLKTVAKAIKMHESTVSRVTSNKFLMCDQGLFELKFFFTSAISAADGEDSHSAEAVKHKIKQFVDSEDPKRILSDDKIVSLLQETGIEIARRTVAKYRESMRIPSSVERRREKAIHASRSA